MKFMYLKHYYSPCNTNSSFTCLSEFIPHTNHQYYVRVAIVLSLSFKLKTVLFSILGEWIMQ